MAGFADFAEASDHIPLRNGYLTARLNNRSLFELTNQRNRKGLWWVMQGSNLRQAD
jgi:hypothetical protein